MIFYRISELILPTLIQKYDKIVSVLIQFKNERLTEIFYRLSDATIYDRINTIYQFIKPCFDKKKKKTKNVYFWGIRSL